MIFHHSFDHINNFIIICDRIKINCHHMFIRNPMMCVKDRKYIKCTAPPPPFSTKKKYVNKKYNVHFFQFLPHISISMSLKSFSIYIVKFFELYISAVLLPIVL